MLEKQKVFFETLLLYFRPFCKIFYIFYPDAKNNDLIMI